MWFFSTLAAILLDALAAAMFWAADVFDRGAAACTLQAALLDPNSTWADKQQARARYNEACGIGSNSTASNEP